jgi:hypothetical protein
MTEIQQRPQPVFDKQDQFHKITANLLQGEFVPRSTTASAPGPGSSGSPTGV